MRLFVACMSLRQRFETLLLFDPNRSPAAANVWISHPSSSEEQALGKLAVVSMFAGHDRVNLDIINLIQEELRGGYYQATDAKPERAFEQALQQLNRRLHQVYTDGVNQWVNSANVLAMAVWRDQLVFSSVGTMHALLFRHGRMHDLVDQTSPGSPNPIRLFSHVTAGQLQADDQVLVCTPSLLDYFSLDKLRRTLQASSPSAAVHQWESTLLGVEQRSSFAAVIMQVSTTDQVVHPVSRPVAQATVTQSAPQVSMEHLIAKEEATERLLSPSIWPAIRDFFSQVGQGLGQFIRRVILRRPLRRTLPASMRPALSATRTEPHIAALMWRGLTRMTSRAVALFRSLRPAATSRPSPPPSMTIAPVLRRRWRFNPSSLVRWWQGINRRQRWLALAGVVLVFILAVSVVQRLAPASTVASPANAQEQISDHLAKARAALLYGGEDTARQELDAAEQLANALPHRSSKDKNSQQTSLRAIAEVREQLAHRTVLANPNIVAQLAAVAPAAEPQQLYLVGTRLIAVDPNKPVIVSATIGRGDAPEVIPNALDTGRPATGVVTGTTVTFATDRRGFVELDVTKGTWKPLDSAWPTSAPRVQALAAYQSRVYALDPTDNDIIRFGRSLNSLGTGTPWLRESANLGQARGLAVDGVIYILQPGGVVELFANNRRGAFNLDPVSPALNNATRIWTDVNSQHLYLVDPTNRRIVVFDKNGQLVDQYTSSSWERLQDVAVSEKNKTAYVLSGTTITSFALLH